MPQTCRTEGPAPQPSGCKKKVKITCKCKRKKEEFKCYQALERTHWFNVTVIVKVMVKVIEKQEYIKILETEEQRRIEKRPSCTKRQMQGGKRREGTAANTIMKKSSILSKRTASIGSILALGSIWSTVALVESYKTSLGDP